MKQKKLVFVLSAHSKDNKAVKQHWLSEGYSYKAGVTGRQQSLAPACPPMPFSQYLSHGVSTSVQLGTCKHA